MDTHYDHRWTLYLDESGRFGNSSDEVVVAGPLIHSSMNAGGSVSLKKCFKIGAPFLYWPLHAAYMNCPVYFAISGSVKLKGGASDPFIDKVIENIRFADQRSFDEVITALAKGKEPDLPTVIAFDRRFMRMNGTLHNKLIKDQRKCLAMMHRILKKLSGCRCSIMEMNAFVAFVSGEEKQTIQSTRLPQPKKDDLKSLERDDRYFKLIECLLERVADRLAATPGTHFVTVQALTRNVLNPKSNREVPLDPGRINRIIEGIRPCFGNRIEMKCDRTPKYDQNIEAEFVLADFISNCCRQELRDHENQLSVVESSIRGRIAAPVRSGNLDRQKSHLAASGVPRQWVHYWKKCPRQSKEPENILDHNNAKIKQWACTQAQQYRRDFNEGHQ